MDLTKIKNNIFDDEVEVELDNLLDATLFPSFGGKLQIKFVKFDRNVFSPYPKIHSEMPNAPAFASRSLCLAKPNSPYNIVALIGSIEIAHVIELL
jgi:hypothetical protein